MKNVRLLSSRRRALQSLETQTMVETHYGPAIQITLRKSLFANQPYSRSERVSFLKNPEPSSSVRRSWSKKDMTG